MAIATRIVAIKTCPMAVVTVATASCYFTETLRSFVSATIPTYLVSCCTNESASLLLVGFLHYLFVPDSLSDNDSHRPEEEMSFWELLDEVSTR